MSEQRARDAVEHLQTAAIEVIEALRALLDIAEDVVRDPAQVASIVQSVADMAKAAERAAAPPDPSGVTRIRVS